MSQPTSPYDFFEELIAGAGTEDVKLLLLGVLRLTQSVEGLKLSLAEQTGEVLAALGRIEAKFKDDRGPGPDPAAVAAALEQIAAEKADGA